MHISKTCVCVCGGGGQVDGVRGGPVCASVHAVVCQGGAPLSTTAQWWYLSGFQVGRVSPSAAQTCTASVEGSRSHAADLGRAWGYSRNEQGGRLVVALGWRVLLGLCGAVVCEGGAVMHCSVVTLSGLMSSRQCVTISGKSVHWVAWA
jgi:hypothetical protein